MSVSSKVAIGTWPLSGDFGVRSLRSIEESIQKAVDAGFKTFDTAPNYGLGFMESALGAVLAGDTSVKIITKCGNHPFKGKDFSPAALEQSIEQSLKRLRRDRIEGVFLHNPRAEIADYGPVIETLSKLKNDGILANIGISGAKGYDYSAVPDGVFDFFQQDANLLYLKEAKSAQPKFRKFFARSPLATGILSGKLSTASVFPPDDHRSGWLKGTRLESLVARVDAIREVLPAGIDVPSAARRFLLHSPAIDTVIFGIGRPEHLDGLIQDVGAGPLPEDLTKVLGDLHDADFNRPDSERSFGY